MIVDQPNGGLTSGMSKKEKRKKEVCVGNEIDLCKCIWKKSINQECILTYLLNHPFVIPMHDALCVAT